MKKKFLTLIAQTKSIFAGCEIMGNLELDSLAVHPRDELRASAA
jgi:hypothetical protein